MIVRQPRLRVPPTLTVISTNLYVLLAVARDRPAGRKAMSARCSGTRATSYGYSLYEFEVYR